MFGFMTKNRDEGEESKDATFFVRAKNTASNKFLGLSRPPNTITYVSPTSADGVNKQHFDARSEATQSTKEPTSEYVSMDNERDAAPSYKQISDHSLARLGQLDPVHPLSTRSKTTNGTKALDLRNNDNSFHIVASLIVDRFEEHLTNKETRSFKITAGDMYHLERVVPDKQRFIDAVRYRVENCPDDSTEPIHVVTRKCHALGLDRRGVRNLLSAPIGSYFQMSELKEPLKTTKIDTDAVDNAKPLSSEDLARQQIALEIQEARNLMAESVTPEATEFWTNQIVELQKKLRVLDGEKEAEEGLPSKQNEYFGYFTSQEGVLSNLWQSLGYAPPTKTEDKSEKSVELVSSPATSPIASPEPSPVTSPLAILEAKEKPIADVVAPADLPGGYRFEAELNGKRFIATVPEGGVQKGKTFYCYMEDPNQGGVLFGRWRDSPIDLFKHGFQHPMLLSSILCPILALSQVMERVGLDITGRKPDDRTPQNGIFSPRGMALSMVFVWGVLNTIILSGFEMKVSHYLALSVADKFSIFLVNASMLAFTIYATINTRNHIMERYQIPVSRFGHQTETVMSGVFFPLTIAQMGRHTASYDTQKAVCCHPTGILEHEEP